MPDTLEARVAELERRLRLSRSRQLALSFALLGVFLMGLLGSPTKAIDSEAFVVRDLQNRKRAALQVDNNGFPALLLYDESGKLKADLSIVLNHPQLNLYNDSGNTSFEAAIGSDGNPGLWFVDGKGSERVALQLKGDDASPVLKMSGPQADPRLVLAVLGPGGQTAISAVGTNGKLEWIYPTKP